MRRGMMCFGVDRIKRSPCSPFSCSFSTPALFSSSISSSPPAVSTFIFSSTRHLCSISFSRCCRCCRWWSGRHRVKILFFTLLLNLLLFLLLVFLSFLSSSFSSSFFSLQSFLYPLFCACRSLSLVIFSFLLIHLINIVLSHMSPNPPRFPPSHRLGL